MVDSNSHTKQQPLTTERGDTPDGAQLTLTASREDPNDTRASGVDTTRA